MALLFAPESWRFHCRPTTTSVSYKQWNTQLQQVVAPEGRHGTSLFPCKIKTYKLQRSVFLAQRGKYLVFHSVHSANNDLVMLRTVNTITDEHIKLCSQKLGYVKNYKNKKEKSTFLNTLSNIPWANLYEAWTGAAKRRRQRPKMSSLSRLKPNQSFSLKP